MTNQETFDLVVAHARRQGCKSVDDAGGCAYRGKNGTMCFAGALIPDKLYRPEFEGHLVFDVESAELRAVLSECGHDLKLCARLQGVHDTCSPVNWERKFRSVAARHGLAYTGPAG